jgi:hypothetical protein
VDAGQIEQMFVACMGGGSLILFAYLNKGPRMFQTPTGRVIALVLGLLIIGFGLVNAYRDREEDVDAHKVAAAARERLKLPRQVDEVTRLDDIVALGDDDLEYINTITSIHTAQVDDALKQRLDAGMRARGCKDPSVQTVLSRFNVTIQYRTIEATEIVRIRFARGSCDGR